MPPIRHSLLASCLRRATGILGFVLILSGAHCPAAPIISEFMADNRGTLKDEDGDDSDWIEVHNPDAAPVNLTGFALSDKAANPGKWLFPDVTVPPGGYLVVFASGKNRRIAGLPLHTNFSLEKNGEYLSLAAPGGAVLQEFAPFPPQQEDRSYGQGRDTKEVTLVAPGATARWKAPVVDVPGWQLPAFNDSEWAAGQTAIGYDTKTSGVIYNGLFGAGGDVVAAMFEFASSCYLRIAFPPMDPLAVVRLKLRMKYDDGFIAYLNGSEADRRNTDLDLGAFSKSATYRPDNAAVVYEDIDLTAKAALLTGNGPNLLALHGMNVDATNRDFLMLPELVATVPDAAAPLRTGYFVRPTPGKVNESPVDGFVAPVTFGSHAGFYDAPVAMAMQCATPQAVIRFTRDGSAPTANSGEVYAFPVVVSSTTVLRAAAFRQGWAASPVASSTILFAEQIVQQPALPAGYPSTWGMNALTPAPADYEMDPEVTQAPAYTGQVVHALANSLPVLSISGDRDMLFAPAGIYSDNRYSSIEVPVSIEYFGPGAGEGFAVSCGVSIHGGQARDHAKKPLRLYFKKEYGPGRLRYPLFADTAVDSFDQLILRPGGHDGWTPYAWGNRSTDFSAHATYLRDQFLRKTEIAMGRLAPHGRYVHLYLNGLYWGVYDLHERPNAAFFASHLGGKEADWDVLHHPEISGQLYSVEGGTADAWNSLQSLALGGISTASAYHNVQSYLDLDAYIDHLIVRMWGADFDWMKPVSYPDPNGREYDIGYFGNKNWYAARHSRNGSGPFVFFCWDAEMSMGSHAMKALSSTPPSLGTPPSQRQYLSNHTKVSGNGTPVAPYAALRKIPAFRQKFADRLQKHFFHAGALSVAASQARLTALESQLQAPMVAESARWGDALEGQPSLTTFTRDAHWQPEVDWLKNTFLTQRNEVMLGQFRAIGLYPFIDPPVLLPHGGLVPRDYTLTMQLPPSAAGQIYYTLDGSDPAADGAVEEVTLLNGASPAKWIIPTGTVPGWATIAGPANLAAWNNGTASVGFDADAAGTYLPHFSTALTSMQGVNPSAWIRISFTLTPAELAALTDLRLRLKYDDGVACFLNGTQVLKINAPATMLWNSAATGARLDADAVQFQEIPFSSQLGRLVAGTNVLAIQGLNVSSTDDDFLLAPELVASRVTPGAIAPGANLYSAPVILPQSAVVKARVRAPDGAWSALTEAAFVTGPAASAGNLILSELHYHPSAPSQGENDHGFASASDFQFVELLNIANETIDLAGVRFSAGIDFQFGSSGAQLLLPPGGRIVVAKNPAALAFRHPSLTNVVGPFAADSNLADEGERITLLDHDGGVIFDFIYGDSSPWPDAADGAGFSLVLRRPLTHPDPSSAANWRSSVQAGGSPGSSDADTFANWSGRFGAPGGAGEDPDADGLPNLIEYFHGSDPLEANRPPPLYRPFVATDAGGNRSLVLEFVRQKAADDLDATVEEASGQEAWHAATGSWLPPQDIGNGQEVWRFSTPIANSPAAPPVKFLRLRIILSP
jgi:hypothetical protein